MNIHKNLFNMTVEQWLNNEQLPIDIWTKKYRYNNESFEEWLDRVSGGNKEVAECIRNKEFIFGGRILAGRGITENKVSYSNCYVITPPEDDLDSIFECAKKMARTYSRGGGCGTDLSKLAPKGAKIRNAAHSSDGITAFMKLFSEVTGCISQSGRRGAAILTLDCNHPDILDFINLKSDLNTCTYANISIKVTDAFMNAVVDDEDWTLSFTRKETGETISKNIKARDILKLIAKRNWEMGEPGLLYWDRIERWNMLDTNSEFKYVSTNPCGEIPMGSGMSCLLGSINLDAFVTNSFTDQAKFDFDRLKEVTRIAVRALNDVLDEGQPLHPLEEQRNAVRDWRQIGLGTTSLATALMRLGYKYGFESKPIINKIYNTIAIEAIKESIELAKEYGPYPKCDKKLVATSSFITYIGIPGIVEDIKKYGIRNCQLFTCAPNGSIGTMIGTGSTGAEPVFALSYNRTTKTLNDTEQVYKVDVPIVQEYKQLYPNRELPSYFITSEDIPYEERVYVQGAINNRIDGSISSTVNLPESATVDDIYNLYILAWKYGCKGCTVFRNNCFRQAILSTDKPAESIQLDPPQHFDYITPISRKQLGITYGSTFCKKCACGTLYITVNRDSEGNIVEVFTHTSKGGICQANTNAITRMASMALRSGVKVDEVVDQLKGIKCPACITLKAKGDKLDGISCPDILSKTIETFSKLDYCIPDIEDSIENDKPIISIKKESKGDGINTCPECGSTLLHNQGCRECQNCGWSKC